MANTTIDGPGSNETIQVDYFVSRRGADAAVAQEVANVLMDAGYTIVVQDFDIPHTATGRDGEAEPLLRDAIAIWQKTVGSEFTDAGRAHETLAQIMLKTDRLEKALAEAQTALAIHDKTLRPEHPRVKASARICADALTALGRGDEAATLCARYGLAPSATIDQKG